MATNEFDERISQLKSPKSAAVAGLLFTLLSVTIMVSVQDLVASSARDINHDWIAGGSKTTTFALTLVPFVGISFLWFTGVLRDWLDSQEDRFFSTIFWSSGILIVAMLFIWAAIFSAMFKTYVGGDELKIGRDVYVFGHTLLKVVLVDYTLRMMGVYMMSIAAIWRGTKVMPVWLIWATYALGITFTLFASKVAEARYVFPAWVFIVSIYILIYNYRIGPEARYPQKKPDRLAYHQKENDKQTSNS